MAQGGDAGSPEERLVPVGWLTKGQRQDRVGEGRERARAFDKEKHRWREKVCEEGERVYVPTRPSQSSPGLLYSSISRHDTSSLLLPVTRSSASPLLTF